MNWTTQNLGSQKGKLILVTGSNTGLGYETALELAKKDARVIMAGRSKEKLEDAKRKILAEVPEAELETEVLDLGSLENIKAFAGRFIKKYPKLDVLINNAGIMFPPASRTTDGFESQFGVNFIGHYALTAWLFPLLKLTENSRVVTLSSLAHKGGVIDFDNLKLEKPYNIFREYAQSKAGNLIFALELQRRINTNQLHVVSVAVHPGVSKTELLRHQDERMRDNFEFMSANQGAWPTLYAATEPIEPGNYYGPNGYGEVNGYPALANISAYASNEAIGKKFWEYTEKETGVIFDFGQ